MAFLALNGFEIPISVKNPPNYEEAILGERFGSYSGMVISSIRGYRRNWNITTAPVDQATANGLRGLIQGRGHNFSFDNSLYSGKNLSGTFTRATTRFTSDGSSVSSGTPGYETGATSVTGDTAIWIEEGTSPLFTTNTFLDTDDDSNGVANGFSSYATGGATGTRSMDATTVTFSRTKSQKIVKSDGGAGRYGIYSSLVAASNPNSCKVLLNITALSASGVVHVEADYYDSGYGYLTTKSEEYSAVTSGWVTCELDTYASASTAYVNIYIWVSGNNGTIYVQAVTSENKNYNTSWTNVTRNAETLVLDPSIFNKYQFTLGCWFKPMNTQVVADRYVSVFDIYIDSENYWKLVISPEGIPYFAVKGRSSEYNTYSSSDTPLTTNTWYFLCVHGDENNFTMTVNGVDTTRGASGTGYVVPVGTLGDIYIGSNSSSTSQANGLYSDMLILPYRLTTEQILAFYGLSRPYYNLPRLELYGTYVERLKGNSIIVEGTFNNAEIIQTAAGNRYILNFDLIEIL